MGASVLNMGEDVPSDLSKRKAIKFIGTGVALGIAGGVVKDMVGYEQQIIQTGQFEARGAVWKPIYENIHSKHEKIVSSLNPKDLDMLSLEFFHPYLFNDDPNKLIHDRGIGQSARFDMLPNEVLENLEENNVKLLFGDLGTFTHDETLKDLFLKIVGGGVLITLSTSEKIKRRDFLKFTGLALAGPPVFDVAARFGINSTQEENKVLSRIMGRLTTISLNSSPENLNYLFRELVQANKLLESAKQITPKSDKPHIAYSWHMAHRGIEDWLFAGQDVCRALILAYPDQVLQKVIEMNSNDPRCLYGARLVGLKKDEGGNVVTGTDQVYEDSLLKELLKRRKVIS